MELKQKIKHSLEKWVAKEDRLLLAVSGGADSMGTLHLLHSLKEYTGKLVVGHVNHHIRVSSAEDSVFIQNICEKLGITFESKQVNVPLHAQENRLSLEHSARLLRYQALANIAKKQNCQWILTAHSLDDSAETVMMRILNKSPWYECTGIPERRERILRPLIGICREDLRSWIAEKSIKFREDETNFNTKFQRNKLRKELAQYPDFWNKETRLALSLSGQELLNQITSLKRVVSALLSPDFNKSKSCFGLAIKDIFHYFSKLSFIPIEAGWSLLAGQTEGRLSSKYRRQITDCLQGTSPSAMIALPEGITLLRTGQKVWLMKNEQTLLNQKISLGEWRFPNLKLRLSRDNSNQEIGQLKDSAVRLNQRLIEKEIYLRNWQSGDKIKISGRGTKNISDLLAERKMNPFDRAKTLVIADNDGPLMIVGGQIAERALPNLNDDHTLKINIQYGN